MRRSLASLLMVALVLGVSCRADAAIAISRDLFEMLDANDPSADKLAAIDYTLALGRVPVGQIGGVRVVICDGIASDAALSAGASACLAMAERSAGNASTGNLGMYGGLVGDLTGAVYTGGHITTVEANSTASIEPSGVTLSCMGSFSASWTGSYSTLLHETTGAIRVAPLSTSNISEIFKGGAFSAWSDGGRLDLNVAEVNLGADMNLDGVIRVGSETGVPANLLLNSPNDSLITISMLGGNDFIDFGQVRVAGPFTVGDVPIQGNGTISVPEPGTALLLAVGLLALAAVGRLRRR